jgi:hypothetical protein
MLEDWAKRPDLDEVLLSKARNRALLRFAKKERTEKIELRHGMMVEGMILGDQKLLDLAEMIKDEYETLNG